LRHGRGAALEKSNDPAFLKLVAADTDGGKVASGPH
jgi:hypothetical protein